MVINKKITKTLGISGIAVLALLLMTIPVFKSGVAYADTGNHDNGDQKQVHQDDNRDNDKNHDNYNKNGHDDDKKRDNDNKNGHDDGPARPYRRACRTMAFR